MRSKGLLAELTSVASSDAELIVAGSLLTAEMGPLPRFVDKITASPLDYFPEERLAALVGLIRKVRSEGNPVDVGYYLRRAQKWKILEGVNDELWFRQKVEGSGLYIAQAEIYAKEIWEAHQHQHIRAGIERVASNLHDPKIVHSGLIILGRTCEALQAELTGTNGIPQIRSVAESLSHPLPLRPPVIHGVLRQSDIMALSGPSKVSKSWTLLAMGLCVSHGLYWLGHPTEPTRVLYCNFEVHASDWDQRIEVVCRALGIQETNPEYFFSLNCRGYDTTHSTILPQISELMRRYRFGLNIVDPSYLLYDEDMEENSNADIARLLRYVTGIATPGKFAVAFSGHFPKGNAALRAAIDRQSGASTWGRYPDCVATVTPLDDDSDEFSLEFQLRGHAPIPRRLLRWKYPLMEVDESVSPTEVKERLAKKAKSKNSVARKTLTKEAYVAQLPKDGTYDLTNPRNGVLNGVQERAKLMDLGYSKDGIRDARELAVQAGLAAVTRSTLRGEEKFVGTPLAIGLWREKLAEMDAAERKRRKDARRSA